MPGGSEVEVEVEVVVVDSAERGHCGLTQTVHDAWNVRNDRA